jgi:HPt (histidine-containing phosphotransfer) domain-containing protein
MIHGHPANDEAPTDESGVHSEDDAATDTVDAARKRVRQGVRIRPRADARAEESTTFSRRQVWQLLDGDPGAIGELIALLTRDLPSYVSVLLDGVRTGDLTTTARLAHKIRGAVGNIEASTVGETARAIEDFARMGDAESVSAQCAPLEVATAELVRDLGVWNRELEAAAVAHRSGAST